MSTNNNKPLTISLQNLNTLYCKYLEQFILQHLPKAICNEVNILLGMKSAIEAYKYLDGKLNNNNISILNSIKNERKSSSSHSNNNNNNNNTTIGGGSVGNINVSVQKDNYQKDSNSNNSNRRMNSLLKRANTYVQRVDENNKNNNNDINDNNNNKITNINNNKFQQLIYGNEQTTIKRVHSHNNNNNNTSNISSSSSSNINTNNNIVYNHHYQQQIQHNKQQHHHQYHKKREQQNSGSRGNNGSNSLGLRSMKAVVGVDGGAEGNFHKDKYHNNNNTNNINGKLNTDTSSQHSGSTNKIQFAKTYSTRQVPINVNRIKLLQLVKQTREMFNDNSKKILRYENLSNDLVVMQQQQLQRNNILNTNINPYFNNTTNSYEHNMNTVIKKY